MNFYRDILNRVHALSDLDIANGGLFLLPSGCIQITQAEADALLAPSAAQIRATFQSSAQVALDKTDLVAIRCLKAGVAFPADWQTYVTDLRNIVNGTDTISTILPTQPTYPAGT